MGCLEVRNWDWSPCFGELGEGRFQASPLQGLDPTGPGPGALPRAVAFRPVGAVRREGNRSKAGNAQCSTFNLQRSTLGVERSARRDGMESSFRRSGGWGSQSGIRNTAIPQSPRAKPRGNRKILLDSFSGTGLRRGIHDSDPNSGAGLASWRNCVRSVVAPMESIPTPGRGRCLAHRVPRLSATTLDGTGCFRNRPAAQKEPSQYPERERPSEGAN